jgi:transposase-like protein
MVTQARRHGRSSLQTGMDRTEIGSVHILTDEIKKLKYPTKKGRRKTMIIEVKICRCPNCQSPDIIRNGTDYKGDQKYQCQQCGGYRTLNPKARYSPDEKARVLKTYQERASMRGIRRIFGVVPQTLLRWIKAALEKLLSLLHTLAPARRDDGLELDELWSFVLKKSNKRWIWIALCRRTRQVVAYFVGDRSEESCRQLWQRLPAAYKGCTS